ncbi:MAG: hypothetical protein IT336_04680, partial [Thermomicrobiales bacterium]|nr:hypothetical protein [Thermomicrobiales bacterium]
MRRVRRFVTMARRRNDTSRIGQAIALPLAGFVAIVSVQLAILSADEALTLQAAAPVIWLTMAFTGLLAV